MKTLEQVQKDYPYATVMTIEEYLDNITHHYITAYDGFGYYHDGETETKQRVNFNKKFNEKMFSVYPYVCWYNK